MTVIQGTPFDDSLLGTLGNNFIYGWQGNDLITGAEGEDILYGDQGNDSLTGGNSHDLLAGGQGNDVLDGGDGNDILYGGQGEDILIGGLGGDRLFGDAGLDTFYLEWDADTVTGGKDKDTFILFPTLGGDSLAEAAVINDFNPLEDELELAGGLTFEGLNIFQGTENYANDTIIQDRNTGRYLAILLNVATPSFVPEATEETPVEETEGSAEEEAEQPLITFTGPRLVMSPPTEPETPPTEPETPPTEPETPPTEPETPIDNPNPRDNQTPTNIILSNTNISENSANGTIIAALSTVDSDQGDTHRYSLIDNAGGRFIITDNQLVVGNGNLIDFETNTQHNIIIKTTDSAGNSFDKAFIINITEVNEAISNSSPTDIGISNSALDENSPNGTGIGILNTLDPDGEDTHTYGLVDDAGGRFAISGNELVVADGTLLDFETAPTHSIVVRTTDSAGQTFNKTLWITINNVNEAPTNLDVSNLIVAENSPNGTTVGTLTTTDLDVNEIHTYTLLDDAGGRFAIEGDRLRVADGSLLDYETATTHTLLLRTTDTGGNSFEKLLTVTVNDVNETLPNNAPTAITLSNTALPENSAIGTVLGGLTTVDPDAGDTHTYSLVDDAGGRFAISGTQITVAESTLLDYETNPSYAITVRTTDAGGLTLDQPFTLSLTDVNEAPTDMGLSNTVIAENSANDTLISAITTTDPDTGDTHTYSLVDDAGGRFGISGNQLIVADGTLLDYEAATSHPIILRTVDAGGQTFDQNFVITLNNVNDSPVITLTASPWTVAQRATPGITASVLQVTDQDNSAAELTYRLVNPPVNGQLKLNGTPLFTNDTFTQADIDNNLLIYTHGVIQLSDNTTGEQSPQISGSNLVWQGGDGNDWEIFFSDGIQVTQLTNNTIGDWNPQISGSNVVWQGWNNSNTYDIYFYNGSTISQLTDSTTDDQASQISGSNIVWQGHDGNDWEIFFYDGNTVSQLTDNTTQDRYPQISGSNVVWDHFDGVNREIWFYEGSTDTKREVTNNGAEKLNFQISGSNVVWQEWDGNDYEIFFYEFSTEATYQLTDNLTNDQDPQISGSNVVWSGYDTSEEIYLYDHNTQVTTPLTTNLLEDRFPQISGSNVVWYGTDGTTRNIYFYDGSTVSQLTDDSTNDFNPQISGTNVIWFGSDGGDNEIFFSPLAGTSVSDSFIFSVSDGVGGMLGNTMFEINVI